MPRLAGGGGRQATIVSTEEKECGDGCEPTAMRSGCGGPGAVEYLSRFAVKEVVD